MINMTNKKISELCKRAELSHCTRGDSTDLIDINSPLKKLIALIIEDCANAAELHARSYPDGEGGNGAKGAAAAVRHYGATLLK